MPGIQPSQPSYREIFSSILFFSRSSPWLIYSQEPWSPKMTDILGGSCLKLGWICAEVLAGPCAFTRAGIRLWSVLGCSPELAAAPSLSWLDSPVLPVTCHVFPLSSLHVAWRSLSPESPSVSCVVPGALQPLLHPGYRMTLHPLAWFTFMSCQPRLLAHSSSPCQIWLEIFASRT